MTPFRGQHAVVGLELEERPPALPFAHVSTVDDAQRSSWLALTARHAERLFALPLALQIFSELLYRGVATC